MEKTVTGVLIEIVCILIPLIIAAIWTKPRKKQRIEKFIWKFRNMAFCYRYAFMGVRLKYRHTNQS